MFIGGSCSDGFNEYKDILNILLTNDKIVPFCWVEYDEYKIIENVSPSDKYISLTNEICTESNVSILKHG